MKKLLLLLLITVSIIYSCNNRHSSGEVIIFHAGSLSVPFKQISDEYEINNPGVRILLEPAGSLVCVRKVAELKKPCDILASSDYFVINELLIPEFAEWSIIFATNEMVIAFTEKSRYSSEIDSVNWMNILMRNDVIYCRADPDSDPGGYRTVMTLMLSEKYYNQPGLAENFLKKDTEYIRPKEVDLVSLMESNVADYVFIYKSVAIQHNLGYIDLPGEVNLSDPEKNNLYKSVSLDVAASKHGSKMRVTGEYIKYSMAILNNAPNKGEAEKFMDFILGEEGMEIFRKNGHNPVIPCSGRQSTKIPHSLMKYLNDK
jgi:molybdate/tungstate transport system substrate-binding protein